MALTPTEEAQVRQLLAEQTELLTLANNEATIMSKLGATKVTLSDLTAVTAIADADLMLARQSTNDKKVTAATILSYIASNIGLNAVFQSSKTANGYQKLPGGLIIQWGTLLVSANNVATSFTFPIPFPTSALNIVISPVDTGTNVYRMSSGSLTATGANAYNTHTAAVSGSWIAIGY